MSEVTPLAQRVVAIQEKGKEYKCLFRDIDTLLYQWQNNTFPEHNEPTTGAYISKQLGWDFPLPDAYLMHLAGQCDLMRKKFATEKWEEHNIKVNTGQLRDPRPLPVVNEILQGRSIHDLPSRFAKEEPQFGTPLQARLDSTEMSKEARANLIIDIASMVIFLLRVNPEVDQWGLQMMEDAGYSRRDLEEAKHALKSLRRQER